MADGGTEFNPNFSDSEKEIISYLVENPDTSYQEIADDREVARGTVTNSVARIRSKTRDAFATLLESPHTEEVAEELEEKDIEQLIQILQSAKE
jgi:transposase-like protein